LEKLDGLVGVPLDSTILTMAGLKTFRNSCLCIHPLMWLTLLEKAEDISLICTNTLRQFDRALPTRTYLTSLWINVPDDDLSQCHFQSLFGSFPNIKKMSLNLRGVKGFNESVQKSFF
jgi:hypothetical protein